ncbi:hypothetical protein J2736_001846 [Paenibacillus qinlingensis]|uniref:Lipoprotein n=1 Tax=Paenibacillus qinlingensis TaxID=1837343 RepID=A0ABU1NT46_9BACL|nr:DUF4846 domain-containing protein [Paenibacillus qinlingensis]MDR6550659.1 hypothetical protein [Paenibacillus qinlingensis]
MKKWIIMTAFTALLLSSCSAVGEERSKAIELVTGNKSHKQQLILPEGTNVMERIAVPKGYERVSVEDDSYGNYLRNLPLKPHGSKVHLFNGELKAKEVYEAVLDVDVGSGIFSSALMRL